MQTLSINQEKFRVLTRKSKNAIKKHGLTKCKKALEMNLDDGDGASTIGFELDVTTRQADAMINAANEYFNGVVCV